MGLLDQLLGARAQQFPGAPPRQPPPMQTLPGAPPQGPMPMMPPPPGAPPQMPPQMQGGAAPNMEALMSLFQQFSRQQAAPRQQQQPSSSSPKPLWNNRR